MVFILPFVFGALGMAVGAVAGAFTAHAAAESDRQAATHHRTVANELAEKYVALEKQYYELADETEKTILDLTRQHALDEVEKDCLRLVVRLQQKLISLMLDIDKYPTEVALKKFVEAVDFINNILCQINEDLIFVPSDYYARNLMVALQSKNFLNQVYLFNKSIFSDITDEEFARKNNLEKPNFITSNYRNHVMKYTSKNIPNQEFQETYNKIHNTGNQLLNYLKELRAERLSKGDTTQGLQSVEDDITKALKALTEQKYQVAVIAAMKAGKSTFLNALIGADVLASEAEACTVCRTDIRPIEAGQTPKLLEYQEGQRQPVVVAEGEAAELKQKFLKRTREIRTTANQDNVTRFELEHPIEAISKFPSLAGFTLVDTPGPNEWESASFNTVALKQTALKALRTCDAILFILDYTSFKDNTNVELIKDLVEQRKDFLANSKGKIYFILNKVDRKSEKDKSIADVIESLRGDLVGFGIPEPIIYPVSAWQALLAKLIQHKAANQEHKVDFKNFFLARYIEEDQEGETHVPKLIDISPIALRDSGITIIENAVIQTVVQNSGWNLLSDVLATLDKAAQAIDETFITEIQGWQVEFEELKQKIEEYKTRSKSAKSKVTNVKNSIEQQKKILISEFSKQINNFAVSAKKNINLEIDKIASNQSKKALDSEKNKNSLLDIICNNLGSLYQGISSSDSYRIKVNNSKEAEKIGKNINEYCTPIIQTFWLDTQDRLVRDGTRIRQDLVKEIQNEIQSISDELSEYIGSALQVEMGTNQIQFPKFEFSGIDTKIQQQQEVFTRTRKEQRTESRCCYNKVYEVDVPYQETVTSYEIDLRVTLQEIQRKIDEQVQRNLTLLQRVIEKQVSEDFQKGEKQINDYINRFQAEFDYLLKARATREVDTPKIISILENQRNQINEYLNELLSIQRMLDSWKPRF